MNNKNILTVALISIAVLLAILGIFYYSFGGPRVDEVTMQQAEADSLRNVLRETQQKLNEEQKQNQKANLTPTLTLEQQQAKLEKELLLK
jgi:flagellar basal body-associated protein FliL